MEMKNTRRKKAAEGLCAFLAIVLSLSAGIGKTCRAEEQAEGTEAAADAAGSALPEDLPSFDVERFVLPEEARMLVVVEGTDGSNCMVYAYERPDEEKNVWEQRLCTAGRLGRNGMSNNRVEGDKTTPIGLFQLDTPFGQGEALEGFPENYVKVNKDHVWVTKTNRLEADSTESGERVGTKKYAGYYEYVLNAGYNKNAVEKKGAALFLHCQKKERKGSAGCVEIPTQNMIELMRLYGAYGDGACYIAQAPRGTFSLIYESYGTNDGLSPEGDFTVPVVPQQ